MSVEDAHAGGIALLSVATHYLHADTYTEHGATKVAQRLYQTALAELGHSLAGMAYAGENHLVGLAEEVDVGSELPLGAVAFEGIFNRMDVAHAIIYYCYHNTPLLEGSL
jgi:hypothetical protein